MKDQDTIILERLYLESNQERLVEQKARKVGYTVKAYHATMNKFNVFDLSKARGRGYSSIGFWFTDNEDVLEEYGKHKMEVFLDVGGVKVYPSWGYYIQDLETIGGGGMGSVGDQKILRNKLIKNNVDSIEIGPDNIDGYEQTIYVVFYPDQIKSADSVTYDDEGSPIPLEKRFDPNNPDIRY